MLLSPLLSTRSVHRLELAQHATSSTHSEIVNESMSTAEVGCEPYTCVSSAYKWLSITWIRSTVYKTNWTGPGSDPCGTPHTKYVVDDFVLRSPQRTHWLWPNKYDQHHWWTVSTMAKVVCSHCSRIKWSTISTAADMSKRTTAGTLPLSTEQIKCQRALITQRFRSSGQAGRQIAEMAKAQKTTNTTSVGG